MQAEAISQTGGGARAPSAKYLTFHLGGEVYGLAILKVQEILGMLPVTHVPRVPEYMRGVINLRGKVIPVVELRRKFGLESIEDTARTCIVVVQVGEDPVTMGFIVDEVSEVLDIPGEDIEDPPSFGTGCDTRFILGMAKTGGSVKILIDVDRVLGADEVAQLHQPA